jgi:hypothetical protein
MKEIVERDLVQHSLVQHDEKAISGQSAANQ